jgi:L-alanine-DL-glutamate epimerase-like enolase superfamily enzyme
MTPTLLGADPTRLGDINRRMDWALSGHPNAKSAIDMACWDILGKKANMPVCELLGGRYDHGMGLAGGFPLYRAISQDSPERMAESVRAYCDQGYRKFQLKVGNKPMDDVARIQAVRRVLDAQTAATGDYYPLLCDANAGWLRHEAMQVVNGVAGLDVYIEQPCATYDECKSVRGHTNLPFVLDECIQDINMMATILADKAADVVNLKVGKLGGLTKTKAIRDLCIAAGIPMNIEDTWGGDVTQAAIAAMAHSTPPELLFCSTDFNSYGPVKIAETTAQRVDGRMSAPIEPGLGVRPKWDVLGSPVFDSFVSSK